MKVWFLIALAALTLNLTACNREQGGAQSGSSASTGQTPPGGATGQASEGSTDASKSPKRPASK